MKIVKLVLKKFKPFLLNNVVYFEYNPHERYQLITGVNGSGKSSLMRELSPLPSDGNLFSQGGKKEIWIEKEGSLYQCVNDYTSSKTGKHSFIKDREELNDSGNVTLQKRLVWDHFKYDNEIHQMVIDDIRWTDMSPIRRRDLFVRLANCNMEYAIDLFNKVKSNARDVVGGIRTTEENIVKKSMSLLPQNVVEEYEKQQQQYVSVLSDIDEILPKQSRSVREVESHLDTLIKRLYQAMERHDAEKYPVWCDKVDGLEELKTKISNLTHEEEMLSKVLNELKSKYEKLESQVDQKQWNDQITDEELEALFQSTEKTYNETKTHLVSEWVNVTDKLKSTFDEIRYTYPDWATASPINVDGQYNRNNLLMKREALKQIETKIFNLNQRKGEYQYRLEHIQNYPTTECPQCRHVWKVGINVADEGTLVKRLKEIDVLIEDLQKETVPLQEWIGVAESIREDRLYFREHFMSKYPMFQTFWSELLDNEDFLLNPSKYAHKHADLERRIDLHLEAYRAENAYKDVSVRYTERMKQKGNQVLVGSLKVLREDYECKSKEYIQLQQRKKRSEKSLSYLEVQDSFNQNHLELIQLFDKLILEIEDSFLIDELKELQSEIYGKLATVKAELDQMKLQSQLIEQMKDQVKQLKRKEDHYKKLIAALNPQDGLIAKSLMGFIRLFVEQINQIIDHVWTYPMNICVDDEIDFTSDYKFPLDIAGRNRINDIGLGSRGQQEFINFAFRLLVMRYLGLSNYPILADELGTSFNESHRLNTFDYIKQLVETGQVEQLFLISHNPTTYDVFNVVDRVHLDPDKTLQSGVIIME